MIRAGELDRRITVERAHVVTNALGREDRLWAPLATVWAKADPISDGERWRAAEVAADATIRFTVLWGLGVTAKDRIIHGGRTYGILGVKEIGRREGQEITATGRAE